MSRPVSDATALRNVRAYLRSANKQLDAARAEAISYRIRATKAEQEVAEWRRRFDVLLVRDQRELP